MNIQKSEGKKELDKNVKHKNYKSASSLVVLCYVQTTDMSV